MNTIDALTTIAAALHGVAPEADLGAIDPTGSLQEELDLDSMDFLNLMTALYDATGIEVPERDYPLVGTIDGFVSYVSSARQPGSTS